MGRLLRGEPEDEALKRQRVRALAASERGRHVLGLVNDRSFPGKTKGAVAGQVHEIYEDLGVDYDELFPDLKGFQERYPATSAEYDFPHPASGHSRLFWFLFNLFLIRNGFEPIYFPSAEEATARISGERPIRSSELQRAPSAGLEAGDRMGQSTRVDWLRVHQAILQVLRDYRDPYLSRTKLAKLVGVNPMTLYRHGWRRLVEEENEYRVGEGRPIIRIKKGGRPPMAPAVPSSPTHAGLEQKLDEASGRIDVDTRRLTVGQRLRWQVVGVAQLGNYPVLAVLERRLKHLLLDPGGEDTRVVIQLLVGNRDPSTEEVDYYGSEEELAHFIELAAPRGVRVRPNPVTRQGLEPTDWTEAEVGRRVDIDRLIEDLKLVGSL